MGFGTDTAVSSERDPDVTLQEYYTLKSLTTYCGIGLRTLRMYLTHPTHPLPHYRVGGKILVKRSEFEAWIRSFRRAAGPGVDAMVAEVLKDF